MKTVKFILLFFMGILFMTSCKVISENEKLITGKWKDGRMTSFIVDKKYAADTNFKASNLLRLGQDTSIKSTNEKQSIREFKMATKSSQTGKSYFYRKTGIDFNSNKTIEIITVKNKIGGTWKMNSKGNKVVVKDTITNNRFTLQVIKITNNQLQFSEKVAKGNLVTTFKR